MGNRTLIILYLSAIVAANLLAARYGPWATVLWAFLFIGLDLTTRDRLHTSKRPNTCKAICDGSS